MDEPQPQGTRGTDMNREEILSDIERKCLLKQIADGEKTVNAERRAAAIYLLFDILFATAIVIGLVVWFSK
jgi:hypothetical protein